MSPRRLACEASTAAQQAAVLFACSGALALVAIPVDPSRGASLLAVGIADVVLAVVSLALPWGSWPRRATLALLPPALAVLAAAQMLGLVPVRAYGVFFTLLFAWVGLHHPPGTAFKIAPLAAIVYALPLSVTAAEPPFDPEAAVLTISVAVMVAEAIAHTVRSAAAARARAERAAQSFATVGRTTGGLADLDPDGVLDAVVDGVMELGYDGVNLAVIDHDSSTFEPRHARGLAVRFAGRRYALSSGLSGEVAATGRPVVVTDYQAPGVARITDFQRSGTRTAVGIPVLSHGELVAVLFAVYKEVRSVEPEDVEALRIVAAHAGAALASASKLVAERQRSAEHATASLTDELTGIGNRRMAHQLLLHLDAGDAVAVLDVDKFKAVNDERGHAAGDQLLRDLAHHLAAHARGTDAVFRYGGEEFVIVMPGTTDEGAVQLLERLRTSWNAVNSVATFSAGIAGHQGGDPVATFARADRALYRAKIEGRNRVFPAEPPPRTEVAGP